MNTKPDTDYKPPFELLTSGEVAKAIRLSRATVMRMAQREGNYFDSTFPQPIQLGGMRTLWRSDEITAWLLSLPRGLRSS